MRYSIEKEILEKVLNYVATKPFSEVASMIMEVQKDVRPIEEPIPEEK